jgi:hypothetical protein
MARPQKMRRICCYPDYWSFAPDGELSKLETVFYSGHCTSIPAYDIMKEIMGDKLRALHSGEAVIQ